MLKKILTVSAVACAAFLAGCGEDVLNPVDKDEVSINLTAMSDIAGSTTAVTTAPITATIDANVAITAVDVTVKKADGTVASGITVTKGALPSSKEKITVKSTGDMPISLSIATTATNGTYIYTLSATAGAATSSKSDTIVLSGMTTVVTTPVTESAAITLGAQENASPSLLDADLMTAYSNTITDAATQAAIDIIFSYSTVLATDALAFTSPSIAAGAPYTTWGSKAASEFKVVAATTTWASITTQEQIDALWLASGTASTRLAVAQGDIVIVKTSAGKYKAINVTTVTGAAKAASIVVKGK
jgi:hypothetical protein